MSAFILEATYELALNRVMMLSSSWVQKRRMYMVFDSHQFAFAILSPRRCATTGGLCQHI